MALHSSAAESSSSADQAGFDSLRDSVKAFLSGLPWRSTRAGVIRFSDVAEEISPLEADWTQLEARLDAMTDSPGPAGLARAFAQASSMLQLGFGSRRQLVLVLIDGNVLDRSLAEQAATSLMNSGVRLAMVDISGTGSHEAFASQPTSENLMYASGYSSIDEQLRDFLTRIQVRCNCEEGATARALPRDGDELGRVRLVQALGHGAVERPNCSQVFPDHTGELILTCDNGMLHADATGCDPSCPAGVSVNISTEQLSGKVVTASRLQSGGASEMPCEDVLGATSNGSGNIRLACSHGMLSASHSCSSRCIGGPTAPPVTARYGTQSVQLRAPIGGLGHGQWSKMRKCSSTFSEAHGKLAFFCMHGQLNILGHCHGQQAMCEQVPPWYRRAEHIVLLVLGILCGLIGIYLYLSGRSLMRKPHEKSVLDERFCQVIPICGDGGGVGVVQPLTTTQSQTDTPPPKMYSSLTCQTETQVFAELEPGMQLPIDLVVCLDTSISVGQEGFGHTVDFLHKLVSELDMPPARVAVITFSHTWHIASVLEENRSRLLQRIGCMHYEPGETKLAEPLHQAGDILFPKCVPMGSRPHSGATHAVIIVVDGEPSDLSETEHEAKVLKERGAQVLVVSVGNLAQRPLAVQLATAPPERFCLQVANYAALPHAAPSVLEQLVLVSHSVQRAKCTVDLPAAFQAGRIEEVSNIDSISGYELMCPGWELDDDGDGWVWRPTSTSGLGHSTCAKWDVSCRPQLPKLVEPSPPPRVQNAMQTDPVVQVSLSAGRHSQLDLVVCLDCSASFSMRRGKSADAQDVVESETFQRAKYFLDHLACSVHMPEVRLALIGWEERHEVVCEFTDDLQRFRSSLKSLKGSTFMTNLSPPLWQALGMLSGSEVSGKAVLVLTDGDPNDLEEATEAAAALRACGAQLLFLRVAKVSDDKGFHKLGVAASATSAARVAPRFPDDGVLEAPDDPDALQALVPLVLQHLLRVQRKVLRTFCKMPLSPYDILSTSEFSDCNDGYEIALPRGPLIAPVIAAWEPYMWQAIAEGSAIADADAAATVSRPQSPTGAAASSDRNDWDSVQAACMDLARELEVSEIEVKQLSTSVGAQKSSYQQELARVQATTAEAERKAAEAQRTHVQEAVDLDGKVHAAEAAATDTEMLALAEDAKATQLQKRAETAQRLLETSQLYSRAMEAEARIAAVERQAQEAGRQHAAQAEQMQRKLNDTERTMERANNEKSQAEHGQLEASRELDLLRSRIQSEHEHLDQARQEKVHKQQLVEETEKRRLAAEGRAMDAERNHRMTVEALQSEKALRAEVEEKSKLLEDERLKEVSRQASNPRIFKSFPANLQHIDFDPVSGIATLLTKLEFSQVMYRRGRGDRPTADLKDLEVAHIVLQDVFSLYSSYVQPPNVEVVYCPQRHRPDSATRRDPEQEHWLSTLAINRAHCLKRALAFTGIPENNLQMRVGPENPERSIHFTFSAPHGEKRSRSANLSSSDAVQPGPQPSSLPLVGISTGRRRLSEESRLLPNFGNTIVQGSSGSRPGSARGSRRGSKDPPEDPNFGGTIALQRPSFSVPAQEQEMSDQLHWFHQVLLHKYGDLLAAFQVTDSVLGNPCGRVTFNKFSYAFKADLDSRLIRRLWRYMTHLAQAEKEGQLTEENWLQCFGLWHYPVA